MDPASPYRPATRWRRAGAPALLSTVLCTGLLSAGTAYAAPEPVDAPRLTPLAEEWGDDDTREGQKSSAGTGSWQASKDLGSTISTATRIGVKDVWGKPDPNNDERNLTGAGVGVALIDTGVAPVEGLNGPGKVVNGPDLSFDSQSDGTRYLDTYGHGTHMAGIIAGRDSGVEPGGEADNRHFVGMAPDATLVNVKVGSADGGVDVSQVIAGIDWVVQNRAKNNIRVLNLSYGTDSVQSPTLDPLAHAVQNAWRNGIVVVVAAGNDGAAPGEQQLTMPAVDPYVLAVGSSDHRGSAKLADQRVGTWTNEGVASRRADVLAPGKSVVGLRVPGSNADVLHPEGRVVGDASGRLFRGTGTSQSAAVVSGAVALLLQRNPALTPDQVKGLLKASADLLPGETGPLKGTGQVDIKAAVALLEKGALPAYRQTYPASTGLGTLQGARGTTQVVDPRNGARLSGEIDVFGEPWNAAAWATASSKQVAWRGGTWRGVAWAGNGWDAALLTGNGWSRSSWSRVSWSRSSWSGADWSSASQSTSTFLRSSWSGGDWLRSSWSGNAFSRSSWSGGIL